MDKKYNKPLVPYAANLRKEMTKEERRLWYDFLKPHERKFMRQKILGRYIADFYCASANLVIELDGSQHYEDEGLKRDSERTEYLQRYGIRVIRIANSEINQNFEGVCEYINSQL